MLHFKMSNLNDSRDGAFEIDHQRQNNAYGAGNFTWTNHETYSYRWPKKQRKNHIDC